MVACIRAALPYKLEKAVDLQDPCIHMKGSDHRNRPEMIFSCKIVRGDFPFIPFGKFKHDLSGLIPILLNYYSIIAVPGPFPDGNFPPEGVPEPFECSVLLA